MLAIINIQDTVIGSWHQITVEKPDSMGVDRTEIRLDGDLVGQDLELHRQIRILLGAWEDEFEGVTDKEAQCEV